MMLPIRLVFIFTVLHSSQSLILKEVTVAPFIIAGDVTSLGCHFDPQVVDIMHISILTNAHFHLKGEQVYSVKWYKGGLEIFRFVPSVKEQPMLSYPRPGVTIDEVGNVTIIDSRWTRPDTYHHIYKELD